MTNFVDVIKACEAANGSGSKKQIQAALATADDIARVLIGEALNSYRVFGVRKFDMPTQYSSTDNPNYGNLVFPVLDKLASRGITGNAARTAVTNMLAEYTEETAKYLTRIIDKDLKAGFSADTFNKVWKNDSSAQIPTFEVMLADKCEDTEDFEKYITFPCLADDKYDGMRTIAIVKDGVVEYFSRSGKVAFELEGIFDEDLQVIRDYLGYDFIMDGERYATDFTETMNAKKEGNDAAKAKLRFMAFFLMPLTHWLRQKTVITMKQNRDQLEMILREVNCKKIVISTSRIVTDYNDMTVACNEAIDVRKVEGLILKNLDSVYEWDRSMAWCKVKRMWDVDGTVVGMYQGRAKSRLENTLGGITVEGVDERGNKFTVNVGSGFSDELRAEIWNNREKYIGTTCTVKYQEMCKAKGSEIFSLRFPVFMHFRDDK